MTLELVYIGEEVFKNSFTKYVMRKEALELLGI